MLNLVVRKVIARLLKVKMDVIPLCDVTKTYTDIYVITQQLSLNTTLFYFKIKFC